MKKILLLSLFLFLFLLFKPSFANAQSTCYPSVKYPSNTGVVAKSCSGGVCGSCTTGNYTFAVGKDSVPVTSSEVGNTVRIQPCSIVYYSTSNCTSGTAIGRGGCTDVTVSCSAPPTNPPGASPTTAPPPVTPTSPPLGSNYTISGKVFVDNAYTGNTSQTGTGGISVSFTYSDFSGVLSTVTKADGTYTITLPYNSGQRSGEVKFTLPNGYSVSPASLDQQLNTGYKQIFGNGNIVKVGLYESSPNAVVNLGLVTPPSSVKVSYGPFTLNTSVSSFNLTGGIPQIMIDQTIQGGGPNGLVMSHAITDKTGKVSITGIKSNEYGYSHSLTVPYGLTIHSVKINGVDVGGRNPINWVFYSVDRSGWNPSLVTQLGNGIVLFSNIVWVDPAVSTAPITVEWFLNASVGTRESYWNIAYPNGGGYCMPVVYGGQLIDICAQYKNSPPGGVTGTDPNPDPTGPTKVPTATVTPTGTPKPVCDIITSTGSCTGAAANTCSTNNGTKTVVYDSSSTGQPCEQKIVNQVCTMDNCSTGNTCQSGVCKPTTLPTTTNAPTTTNTPTPTQGETVFSINLGLDGIGSTGDSVSPDNSSGSNKNPVRKVRDVTLSVFNNNDEQVYATVGSAVYDTIGGKFLGSINTGTNIANGTYTVKLQSNGYLRKIVPGFQIISSTNSVNNVALKPVSLVTGDVNLDNSINILDYNIFKSCWVYTSDSGQLCNSTSYFKQYSDLDDNGAVDQFDYNLYLREYSVQKGQ